MKQLAYEVSFTTPAFLGNAEQSGQWRTPPFKALLRQWWRVVYAADHGFNVNVADMRREEGLLFGNAWLSPLEGRREVADHRKSLVRMRLDRWDEGRLKKAQWPADTSVSHPEVPKPIGAQLYLGYGPLEFRGGTVLKKNAAIQAGESATLSLVWPSQHNDPNIQPILDKNGKRIEHALWLMDRFGSLGCRSRNGWGSLAFTQKNSTPALSGKVPLRDWQACLDRDWPHAIGQDGKGPLVWQTAPHEDWKSLMKTLAIVKIGLRTQFVFLSASPPHPNPMERHWLSYPITRHTTSAFDRNARLPNQLRLKVRAMEDGKLVGVIYRMPCLPPKAFRPNKSAIIEVWKRVHALLDELCKPSSARGYASITDVRRRSALKPHLDGILLKRIPE